MQKINRSQAKDAQLVDIRQQSDFQQGHIPGSLNLNPQVFTKYGEDLLNKNQTIVWVVDDEENLEDLQNLAKDLGIKEAGQFIQIQEIPQSELDQIETISTGYFLESLESSDKYILLDLRTPEEITRSAPKQNLVNIPLQNLTEKFEDLNQDKKIYTLCGSGNRATTASSFLKDQNYQTAVIEGGMKAIEEQENK